MRWHGSNTFVLILLWMHLGESNSLQEVPIEDYFSKDWSIDGNDSLVYSRSFNRHREFGYVTCDKRVSQICEINVVHADAADYRVRSCGLRYDLITGKTGDIALYLPDDDKDVDSEYVVQAWWLKGEQVSDTRLTALQLRSCMNAGFDITPVTAHPSRSRLVPYRYPNFDLVYDDAFSREKRVQFVTFRDRKTHERAWTLKADQKYMYEEKGVELADSSRGFFYLGTNGEPDWRLKVMYANSSSAEVRKLGVIEHLREAAATRAYPKTSGAHQKYALCWKNLKRNDGRVNCTQFKIDGRRSINEVSLVFPGAIDWLAVHNLEKPAMLIVSGECVGGKCNQFSVTKIDASGRKNVVAKINNLDAECPTAPFDISMDVVEDSDKNQICFNFVCLSTRYKESSAEKANTTLQYRRHCIDKDFVERIV